MTNSNAGRTSPARPVLTGALVTFGLTALHHIYGGVVYRTPWRHHGAAAAVALGVAAYALYARYRRGHRWAGWTLAALALAGPVIALGAFEGAYNHVAKNALFLAGAPRAVLLRLFPPPTYELPNDLFFEITGVAQVIPAAATALGVRRFVRRLRQHRSPAGVTLRNA